VPVAAVLEGVSALTGVSSARLVELIAEEPSLAVEGDQLILR
jgi:hypothetical protein